MLTMIVKESVDVHHVWYSTLYQTCGSSVNSHRRAESVVSDIFW